MYGNVCTRFAAKVVMVDDASFSKLWTSMMTKRRRRMTWEAKKHKKQKEKYYVERARRDRTSVLQKSRQCVSLACGLIAYRKALGLNRTQFATMLGITRRALYNYENGTRSIDGGILEAIVQRGDVELNDIFSIPPDPRPFDQRKKDAELTIDLLFACAKEAPHTDLKDIRAETIFAVARWPRTRDTSEKSINKVAKQLMDELDERYLEEEYWKQVDTPK